MLEKVPVRIYCIMVLFFTCLIFMELIFTCSKNNSHTRQTVSYYFKDAFFAFRLEISLKSGAKLEKICHGTKKMKRI